MMAYLAKTGGTSKSPKQVSYKDVVMGSQLTPEQIQQVQSLVKEYKDVFMSSPDDIPPALKVKPVEWQLKQENPSPVRCKRPNWGPAQRSFLKHWTRKALDQGLIVPADKSQWASRPVLVAKYRGDTPKGSVPDDIRICIDYIAVNEKIKRLVDQYPDPQTLLQKAAGHRYYFAGDAQKQFNALPLSEKSQELTTFWTPLGLMKYTRLIMGSKNASAIAQALFTRYLAENLTDEELSQIVNFQDDFLGFANSWTVLLKTLEAFLKMCRKTGIKMNPAKMYVGVKSAKFYGYTVSSRGLEPAKGNLDPIKKLTAPTNRSEVRSLLGLFVQFRRFFERYDRLAAPIQQLLRKDCKFEWKQEQQEALEKMKERILQPDVYLAAPRKDLPLILETDGSDDGWGAILLQVDPAKPATEQRQVISMWSGQWKTAAMRKSPPYYKETKAWMNGITKARLYADAHPMAIKCITDHIPMTWVKNTTGKGPVSQFILDNLSNIDYTIEYRPGKLLVEADAVSRYPCLGPRILSDEGKQEALKTLFQSLPRSFTPQGRLWVNSGKDTQLARETMQQWQFEIKQDKPRVPLTDSPSPGKIANTSYAFAVFAPDAKLATQALDAALTKKAPFACLLPISLVGMAATNQANKDLLQAATKIVLLDPEMVWIVHNIPGFNRHQVHARTIHRMEPEPEGILAGKCEIVIDPKEQEANIHTKPCQCV